MRDVSAIVAATVVTSAAGIVFFKVAPDPPFLASPHWYVISVAALATAALVVYPPVISKAVAIWTLINKLKQGKTDVRAEIEEAAFGRDTPGWDNPALPVEKASAAKLRAALFENNLPTYVLDKHFNLLDWN